MIAHDHGIGAKTFRFIHQRCAGLAAAGVRARQCGINPLMLEMYDGIAPEQHFLFRRYFIADHHDGDFLGLVQISPNGTDCPRRA
jgi:hypothetical protein